MRAFLKYSLVAIAGFVASMALLAGAMWLSADIRYGVIYFLDEHFDLNSPITAAQLDRQTRALKRASLVDADGKPFDWNARPGAIVWINEWANWCVPCRMEFASMTALQQRVGKNRLRVVLLSQPRYWDADKRLAKDLGLDFELVTPLNPPRGEMAAINLSAHDDGFLLPENTFMRADGRGLKGFHAVRDWDSAVWESLIRRWYGGR